jgi:hypothetical protein
MTTALSTDNRANIEIPGAASDLPFPSNDYRIVVAATTSLKMEAHTAQFDIENPLVEIAFPIVRQSSGTPLAEMQASVLEILSSVLEIEPSRLFVDIVGNCATARIQPTSSLASHAAFEAAQLLVNQWTDPTSPLNKAVNTSALFSIDPRGKTPMISFIVEAVSHHARRLKMEGILVASIFFGVVAIMFLAVWVK